MLSTKDVKGGDSSNLPKTLKPGNVKVKINKVELEPFPLKVGAYHFVCHVETEPIEGFTGFAIDKNDPSKGNHAGQVGKVKAGQYAYQDSVTKGGKAISRDMEIMRHIKFLCLAVGKIDWFDAQDGKHATIEAFVEAFNKEKPFENVYIHTCLAGKKYKNNKDYDSYDLFFAKYADGKAAFSNDPKKVVTFDEKIHVTEKPVENVDNFSGGNDNNSAAADLVV